MIKTTWASIKAVQSNNSNTVFYSIESDYSSNNPNIPDTTRYYIRVQDGIDEYYTFICIQDPANPDQTDFETNYKPTAIEV